MATDYVRRHAFAAFVWALGVRGEGWLTPNGADFDMRFMSVWDTWCRGSNAAGCVDLPSFDEFKHGRRPQDVMHESDRWRSNSPLDGWGRIRDTSGRDVSEALDALIENNPELGTTDAWLDLADLYLERTAPNKKD